MKAQYVSIQGIRDVAILEEELDPNTLGPTACLMETHLSLISPGTELSRVYGLKQGAAYPVRPGYCSVGTVLQKGSQVNHVKAGDRVLFSGPHSSHQIYDYTTSDGGILYPLDPRLTDEEGAFLMMGWIAMNGILPADVKISDTVVIFGLGTLGTILSVLYQEMGTRVIAVDPVGKRCEMARSMGIRETLDCPPADQVAAIMEATQNRGADIIVDATGLSACILSAFEVATTHGQVLLLGSPRTPHQADVTPYLNMLHRKMLTVHGAFNRRYATKNPIGTRLNITRSMDYLSGLLINKKIDVDHFISHQLAPEAIMEGYHGLMNNKDACTGVTIRWKE